MENRKERGGDGGTEKGECLSNGLTVAISCQIRLVIHYT